MIIIKLNGGLGNQMFQYAFGKHLANKHKTNLKLDISFFDKQTLRKFELLVFNIQDEIITTNELEYYLPSVSTPFMKKIIGKLAKKIRGFKFIQEKQFNFSVENFNTNNQVFLEGYWQSEKYFKPSEKLVRGVLNLDA